MKYFMSTPHVLTDTEVPDHLDSKPIVIFNVTENNIIPIITIQCMEYIPIVSHSDITH